MATPAASEAGASLGSVRHALPSIVTPVPGPQSRALAARLRRVESPNVTYVSDRWPIFWRRAAGCLVEDVDGNRYLDMNAAFGVAAVGHANPHVARAAASQAAELTHGMGDVHPTALKVELAERLAELAPGGLCRTLFSSSGSDAVESALKTARIATGKPGVIAFDGAYHGLGYGALDATGIAKFREPFEAQLAHNVVHAPYPTPGVDWLGPLERALADPPHGKPVGAVLIEPVLGRGGDVPAAPGALARLRQVCDERELLLIADEIYTGFGRTGRWFACEHAGVAPDLLCVGKGMTGGFPISACIGTARVMDAWGESTGEALHTSTFLGNPLGCAMALAVLDEIADRGLIERAERVGAELLARLGELGSRHPAVVAARGLGLMIGIEFEAPGAAARLAERLLASGVIVLPSGPAGQVLSLSPPLTIDREQIDFFLEAFDRAVGLLEQEG